LKGKVYQEWFRAGPEEKLENLRTDKYLGLLIRAEENIVKASGNSTGGDDWLKILGAGKTRKIKRRGREKFKRRTRPKKMRKVIAIKR